MDNISLDKCSNQIKITKNIKKILHVVNECNIDTILNQRDIANMASINIATVNRNMMKLVEYGLVVEKKISKNSRKYFIETEICGRYGIELDNSNSTLEKFEEKENLEELRKVKDDLHIVSNFVDKNKYLSRYKNLLSKFSAKITSNGIYWFIDNRWHSAKQIIDRYINLEKDDQGHLFYRTNNPHSYRMYRNHLLGGMVFNVDFSSIESITPDDIKNVNRFRDLIDDTPLAYIKNKQIIKLIKMFDIEVIFSKLVSLRDYFRKNSFSKYIRNIFAYLRTCFSKSSKIITDVFGMVDGKESAFRVPYVFKVRLNVGKLRKSRLGELYKSVFGSVLSDSTLYRNQWKNPEEIFGYKNPDMLISDSYLYYEKDF